MTVSSAHKEKQRGETVEVHTKRVIPLPFVATPSMFQIIQGCRFEEGKGGRGRGKGKGERGKGKGERGKGKGGN